MVSARGDVQAIPGVTSLSSSLCEHETCLETHFTPTTNPASVSSLKAHGEHLLWLYQAPKQSPLCGKNRHISLQQAILPYQ